MNTQMQARSRAGFGWGAVIGSLGGLIGLGGAEFRLPVLVGRFKIPTLEAVILNKAMSLMVVAFALVFRGGSIPFAELWAQVDIAINLLAGSLVLMISLPTMLVGFARYRESNAFAVLGHERPLLIWMAAGSIVGAGLGALMLGLISSAWLLTGLGIILLISAVKVFQHTQERKHP